MGEPIISALIIAGYFSCWALIHTALASIRVKKIAERLFGPETPRYYRLFFVLFAIVSLIPLVILIFTLPDQQLYAAPSPWRWILHGIQAVVFVFMARTIVQTEAMNFLGIEQLRSKERNTGSELQTGGLYRFVRHPMYFTSIIVIWTTPIMTLHTATLFACMTIYFYLGSIHEEKLLVIQFGEKYVSYKKKVPRILPGPRSFTSR